MANNQQRRAFLKFDEKGEPWLVDRRGRQVVRLDSVYKDGVDLVSAKAVEMGLDPLVLLWDFVRPDEVKMRTNWTDAFNKFGYENGQGALVKLTTGEEVQQTEEVAWFLGTLNMQVSLLDFKHYNTVIASIFHPGLRELVPHRAIRGYSDPTTWLPGWLKEILNTRYGVGYWRG